MTTISQAPRESSGAWALRAALIGSLLVHLAIFVVGTFGYDAVTRALDPASASAHAPPPANEVVTISSPIVIEKRVAVTPPAQTVNSAFGAPRAALSMRSLRATPAPPLTATQRAFAEALAHNARAAIAAASVTNDPARVPEKYRLTMQGKNAKLKRGQGIYFPTRGWRQDGLDYYEVSYEFVYADGADEKGSVPWPIHFDPASDPFFSPDFEALSKTPMPGPPAGFVPPGDLGKALRAYFPSLHFEDQDN